MSDNPIIALARRWVEARGSADTVGEVRAFRDRFGEEDAALLTRALDEYLSSPDRRGRANIADLERTVARLRPSTGTRADQADLDRSLAGIASGQLRCLGFDPQVEPTANAVEVWAAFGDFTRRYSDRDPRCDELATPRVASGALDSDARRRMEATILRLERLGWYYDPARDVIAAEARKRRASERPPPAHAEQPAFVGLRPPLKILDYGPKKHRKPVPDRDRTAPRGGGEGEA